MTSFSEILDLAKGASGALDALEEISASRVHSAFDQYENKALRAFDLRTEMIRQARAGFESAGILAVQHINDLAARSGIPSSDTPTEVLKTAPVLDRIILDMNKNYLTYSSSEKTSTDLRRLRFRVGLGVQAAVRRGFQENQLNAAADLRARGAVMKKIWLANFVNNVPCEDCKGLHGTEIPLSYEFPRGGEKSRKVFHGLQGPPRHPNCHCYMLIYVVTLETAAVVPEMPVLEDQKFMTSKDVRRLPRAVYTAAVTTLRLIAGKLKGALRGK
jgi:hypothetical protein